MDDKKTPTAWDKGVNWLLKKTGYPKEIEKMLGAWAKNPHTPGNIIKGISGYYVAFAHYDADLDRVKSDTEQRIKNNRYKLEQKKLHHRYITEQVTLDTAIRNEEFQNKIGKEISSFAASGVLLSMGTTPERVFHYELDIEAKRIASKQLIVKQAQESYELEEQYLNSENKDIEESSRMAQGYAKTKLGAGLLGAFATALGG